jgi:pimeloyl-ACP methyl ester carboxylesterase
MLSDDPLATGERIQALNPDARLHVIRDGTHSFAHDRAADVARLIAAHLTDCVGIDEPHILTRA